MKKLFFLFVVFVATTTLWAEDFSVDGIYYNYLEDNNVEVTYKGSDSYTYDEYSGEVTIPSTVTYNGTTYNVTSIGGYAFFGCSSLTSITIPNSVTSIGNLAFYYCSSLTSITIPESVTSIGDGAFGDCDSLTSITIGNSVTSIGGYAFNRCSSLTSITIPNSVTSIGKYAFDGCSSLTSVTIPNSVKSIGESAFLSCSSLTSITIPNSVTSIEDRAFASCSSLTSVTIPNSVTSIGIYAFDGCSSLTSITIPNSVTSIGGYAFNRTGIYNNESNWEDNVLYIDNCLIEANTSISGSYTIKENTRLIAGSAFFGCDSLTTITIPNSVTSIGEWAFLYCSSLVSMVVESGNTIYDSRDTCNAIIETATNTLIAGCQNTTIPNSVTSIGGYAFFGCSSLTSITLPNSVTSIGEYAFSFCESLRTVICEAVEVPELGSYVFRNTPITEATLYVPEQSLDDYKAADQWKDFGRILPLEEAPSAVENTRLPIANGAKLLRDGQVYILKDNKVYTLMGQEL